MQIQTITVDGQTLEMERRRYGETTYTWVYLVAHGNRLQLGDPWPVLNPKRTEIREALAEVATR